MWPTAWQEVRSGPVADGHGLDFAGLPGFPPWSPAGCLTTDLVIGSCSEEPAASEFPPLAALTGARTTPDKPTPATISTLATPAVPARPPKVVSWPGLPTPSGRHEPAVRSRAQYRSMAPCLIGSSMNRQDSAASPIAAPICSVALSRSGLVLA